jgi:hypothetical protein
MNPAVVSIALAVLAVVGQLVNVFLHLRIANAILLSKGEIMDQVRCQFRTQELCDAKMDAQDGRLAALEPHPRPRHA